MTMNLNEEAGFTLLEALIALMMTSSILLLLIGGLSQAHVINQKIIMDAQVAEGTKETVFGDRQIEWHLFLNQLEMYLEGTLNPKVSTNQIEVTEINEQTDQAHQVIYRRPDSGNRRVLLQYKNNGKLRMLTDIASFNFLKEGNWLKLDFIFQNGDHYTGRIWVDSWIENGSQTEK